MNVEALIDELEEVIEKGFKLPLTDKLIIEYDRVKEIISELKLALPQEIRQAQNIVKDSSDIISNAKKEADAIVKVAEEKQMVMLNQNEIVRQANLKAKGILDDAENKSSQIKTNVNAYIENTLKRADEMLTANLNDIKRKREEFKKIAQNSSNNK